MSPQTDLGQKTVVSNRRARHDYEILERFEAGLVLTGAEVKSLRGGRGSLAEAFARVRNGEVWIEGMHIPPYEQAVDKRGYDPTRTRKLLLHRKEIERLIGKTAERGLALVPLRVYFVHGIAKMELGLGRGKRRFEKRQGRELWSSGKEITSWNHWSGMTVANGRVYLGTFDGTLYSFGVPAAASGK